MRSIIISTAMRHGAMGVSSASFTIISCVYSRGFITFSHHTAPVLFIQLSTITGAVTAAEQYILFSPSSTGCHWAAGIIHSFPGGIFTYSQEDIGFPQNTSIPPTGSETSDLSTVNTFLPITTS